MWSPCAHSVKTNGPVPTALVFESGPSIVTGSMMFRYSNRSNMAGRGWSERRTMVFLSGVSMDVNQLLWFLKPTEGLFGSRTRRRFHLTSSLVNSRPVCQVTPLRRLNLYCVAFALTSQDSARRGWISSLSLYAVRRSQTFQTESY